MTKVSVIIAAYNAAAYVGKALDSVLAQTEKSFEAIVVDDASTDATAEIVRSLAAKDNRIRLIELTENRGNSFARNTAIAAARGEWLAILDADDWYAPERLEALVAMAEAQNADVVADNQYFVMNDEADPWRTLLRSLSGKPLLVDIITFLRRSRAGQYRYLNVLKPVIRRSFLEDHAIVYDEGLRRGSDFGFLLTCLAKSRFLALCQRPMYYYRNHAASLTGTYSTADHVEKWRKNKEYVRLFQAADEAPIRRMLDARSRSIMRYVLYRELRDFMQKNEWSTAFRHILQHVDTTPYFVWTATGALFGKARRMMVAASAQS